MKPVSAILTKAALLAAAGIGLSACVATVPEPVVYHPSTTYYAAPGYYYQPYYYRPYYYEPYYAPWPAYNYFSFSYSDVGGGHGHHHGHHH